MGSEKIPVQVPLPSFEALKELPELDEKLREAVLLGLTTQDCGRVGGTL